MALQDVQDIPKNVWDRNLAKQDLQRHHICLTDCDHYYILEEIEDRKKIECEINKSVGDDKE